MNGERQALTDQGDDDRRKGEKENQRAPGNGCPDDVTVGIARAPASVTMPRMPDHERDEDVAPRRSVPDVGARGLCDNASGV